MSGISAGARTSIAHPGSAELLSRSSGAVLSALLLLAGCSSSTSSAQNDAALADDSTSDTSDATSDDVQGATDGSGAGVDSATSDTTVVPDDAVDAEDVTGTTVEPLAALPPQTGTHTTDWFTSSSVCGTCHTADSAAGIWTGSNGDDISPSRLWRGSMMAYSARDPYWLAAWSHELEVFPQAEELISSTCTRCHAAAAHETLTAAGSTPSFISHTRGEAPADHLGREGVTCTVCHQVEPTDDVESTFTGGFALNHDRSIYGPFENPFANPMINQSGFTPTPSPHMRDSQLCASCHTVITRSLDAAGEPAGEPFVEQAPYLEWSNSIFRTDAPAGTDARSCQSCHMRSVDATTGEPLATVLSVRPPDRLTERSPVRAHTFVGANQHMLQVLREQQEWAGLSVDDALLAEAIEGSTTFMTSAATLEIADVVATEAGVTATVRVTNRSGHKFPTGYPSRRAWIELRATDADGNLLWHSGGFNEVGELSTDATESFQPHRDRIDAPDQVMIYGSVMQDVAGEITHTLLAATSYRRDNRLLPAGWQSDGPWASMTAPVGVGDDASFVPGSDTVTYELVTSVPVASIDATLWYQAVPWSAVHDLHATPTPASTRLHEFFEETPPLPVRVSGAEWSR